MATLLAQMTVNELADALDAGEELTLIDTRPPESYNAWHIEGATNIPYHPADGLGTNWDWEQVSDLAATGPLVVICGKGLTSTSFGFELGTRGYDDVRVVKGGMEDWSKLYEIVEVETENPVLYLAQVQRRAKGCLGYVIGSHETNEAVVVDATRQSEQFELVAADEGMRVVGVCDTHVHADHISGGRALASRLDVPYYMGSNASDRDVQYDYVGLDDGETISVGDIDESRSSARQTQSGDIDIEVLHAPGHTSDMVAYLVDGQVLLTGDTLFVESVGRTELQFGDRDAATGAQLLYQTLHESILELPEETRILPGHVSVDSEGRYGVAAPGELVSATLGELRESLDFLSMDEHSFIERITGDLPEKPPNYERIIALNTGRGSLDGEEEATQLELGPNNCAA